MLVFGEKTLFVGKNPFLTNILMPFIENERKSEKKDVSSMNNTKPMGKIP